MDVASAVAKCMAALAGPASRWVQARRANRIRVELEMLADPAGQQSRKLIRDVRPELAQAGLESAEIVDAMRAIRSPLMEACLRMAVVEATAHHPDEASLELIRQAIAAVLSVETQLEAARREAVARVLEQAFTATSRQLFTSLVRISPAHAQLVQQSAVSARYSEQLATTKPVMQRAGHMARLTPFDLAVLNDELSTYASQLLAELTVLSVPTPTREFIVSLDEAFVDGCVTIIGEGEFTSTSLQMRREAVWEEAPDQHVPDLLHLLATHGNLILFGDPGSGKSTNIQAAVVALAREVANGSTDAVPVRVTIRDYAREFADLGETHSVFDHLVRRLNNPDTGSLSALSLHYLFHSGRAVVFFDGLDEVLETKLRRDIVRRLSAFMAAFPSCTYSVSSRFAGYDQAPMPRAHVFTQAQTEPLTSADVMNYAAWFFRNHGLGPYRHALGVNGFMEQTKGIVDLRSNPLMLGVLCGLYASGRTVPSNRSELYKDCARMLFEQWDQLKGAYRTVVDHEIAEEAVRRLANLVLTSGREDIQLSHLAEFLHATYQRKLGCSPLVASEKAQETIDLWRGRRWILVFDGRRKGDDWYRFSHRTFLEFFASEHEAYVTSSGRKLFKSLSSYIYQRSPLPYVHLSAELISRRRASDGDSFLSAALEAVEDNGIPSVDRLSCAITIAEILPSLRLEDFARREDAVRRLLVQLAEWLPRTPEIENFYDSTPYAYADWRYMNAEDSSTAAKRLESSALDVLEMTEYDDEGEGDLGVDYIRAAQVVLGLDAGQPESDSLMSGVIEPALRRARETLTATQWVRLLVFLRFSPFIEGAELFSSYWRGRVFDTAGSLLSESSLELDVLDARDTWLVILAAREGVLKPLDVLPTLSTASLYVGGTPFPVLVPDPQEWVSIEGRSGTREANTVPSMACLARKFVEELLLGSTGNNALARALLSVGPHKGLFVDLYISVPLISQRSASLTPVGALALSWLVDGFRRVGDEATSAAVLASLDGTPSHRLVLAAAMAQDSDEVGPDDPRSIVLARSRELGVENGDLKLFYSAVGQSGFLERHL